MTNVLTHLGAAAMALAIFLVDLSPVQGAVAVLYVLVVLIVSQTQRSEEIVITAAVCIILTAGAYLLAHPLDAFDPALLRFGVGIAAITMATLLALQNLAAVEALYSQTRLLDLSHDMIIACSPTGTITFWNRAAEATYGWSAADAIGQSVDVLLDTRYPEGRDAVMAALSGNGRWEGTLEHLTKAGDRITLNSKWAAEYDSRNRLIRVLETHTDITARHLAHTALMRSERRFRRMFESSRIGVIRQDWSEIRRTIERLAEVESQPAAVVAARPDIISLARRSTRVLEINPAFLAMVGASDAGQYQATVGDVLIEDDRTFAPSLSAFISGKTFYEGETEIVRIDGRKVPVLFTMTFPTTEDEDGNVLVFVLDVTERNEAQNTLNLAKAELAHATRVATLGELTASLAHEVNQPLMAVITNGEAGLRWLQRDLADLGEAEAAILRAVAEGRRASQILNRVRDFLKKAPPLASNLNVDSLVEDSIALVHHDLARCDVTMTLALEQDLPMVRGDRVQFQQVLINLMLNAAQAMVGRPLPRKLTVDAKRRPDGAVDIAVSDNGPGIPPQHLERLFDPFFTTKPGGMGMGLAICRTTAETYGAKLSVESSPLAGSTFRFSIPSVQQEPGS